MQLWCFEVAVANLVGEYLFGHQSLKPDAVVADRVGECLFEHQSLTPDAVVADRAKMEMQMRLESGLGMWVGLLIEFSKADFVVTFDLNCIVM